jgi:hypothetical protein
MAIKTDNVLDQELVQMKSLLERLKQSQKVFSVTFQNLPPKERAKQIKQIQSDHRAMTSWLEKAKKTETVNSGTRFGVENLRQSFQAQLTLWRKTEKTLENFSAGSGPKTAGQNHDETSRAVDAYVTTLRNVGHVPTPEMVNEFKTRLEAAYEKAKSQSGGRELSINIVQEGSKIKVKLEPK